MIKDAFCLLTPKFYDRVLGKQNDNLCINLLNANVTSYVLAYVPTYVSTYVMVYMPTYVTSYVSAYVMTYASTNVTAYVMMSHADLCVCLCDEICDNIYVFQTGSEHSFIL
jgi:hypothetical protein